MKANLTENLAAVRARVHEAARVSGRDPAGVRILLAVKTQPAEVIRAAIEAGGVLLGHNRAQELAASGPALAEPEVPPHEMHFIGHLQSNKVNQVLRWASCVQSVDSVRIAERLNAAVGRCNNDAENPTTLDVMVQVNTSAEPTKAGVGTDEALDLARSVAQLSHLRLRGFMTIGAHTSDTDVVRASYDALAAIRDAALGSGEPAMNQARELSMGMSADLETAVAAGATMVRLGSAVFGERPPA